MGRSLPRLYTKLNKQPRHGSRGCLFLSFLERDDGYDVDVPPDWIKVLRISSKGIEESSLN